MQRYRWASLSLFLLLSVATAPASAQTDDATTAPTAVPYRHHMPSHARNAASVPHFSDEQSAQTSCPSDTVVWMNTRSGAIHAKGSTYYGKTKHGAYVCKGTLGARRALESGGNS